MDWVYSVLIILVLSWIGLVLCGIVKALNKGVDLKEEEQRMKIADGQMKIQRDNANLALQNDLRGFMRSVFKKFFEEEDPELDPEKEEEKKDDTDL